MHPRRSLGICQTMSGVGQGSQAPTGAQEVLDGSCWVAPGTSGARVSVRTAFTVFCLGMKREVFNEKAQLALGWHFLKRHWHSTTFTCLGLQKETRLLLLCHFPQHTVGLESYVNWCLDWHIFGQSIPNTPADGWHTCFPESWFKKQFSISVVQDFCVRFCTFPRDLAERWSKLFVSINYCHFKVITYINVVHIFHMTTVLSGVLRNKTWTRGFGASDIVAEGIDLRRNLHGNEESKMDIGKFRHGYRLQWNLDWLDLTWNFWSTKCTMLLLPLRSGASLFYSHIGQSSSFCGGRGKPPGISRGFLEGSSPAKDISASY